MKLKKLVPAALSLALVLSLAACGSSASTGTASTSASADGVVYRTLDEIKADGTINIGVSLTRTRSATSMKTASIRAMTSTLPTAWPRIWASR